MVQFRSDAFWALSGPKLYAYYDSIEQCGRVCISERVIVDLMAHAWSGSIDHAIYIIGWAVQFGAPGAADLGVELCRRYHESGARYTVIRALCDARDLSNEHLKSLTQLAERSSDRELFLGIAELSRLRPM